jgi:hypothetical protein
LPPELPHPASPDTSRDTSSDSDDVDETTLSMNMLRPLLSVGPHQIRTTAGNQQKYPETARRTHPQRWTQTYNVVGSPKRWKVSYSTLHMGSERAYDRRP